MVSNNLLKLSVTCFLSLSLATAFAQKSTITDEPIGATGDQPVNSDWKPSLVPDGSYDRMKHIAAPIPWQYIREADVLWRKRVWRQIDVFEKQNIGFRYQGDENTGGGMFVEILFDAIKRGKISAYSNFDDRFTTKLTKDQVMEQLTGKIDSITQDDPITGLPVTKIFKHDFKPDDIVSFTIKEDWIFDRNQGKMVVHIVGLAPKIIDRTDAGDVKGTKTMFWLSYPEIRPVLAAYEVFNPQNDAVRQTWDEFFESRQFSSKIIKVSNSLDQRYEQVFGDDPRGKMEALYESQQDANEIFNKEHDMWIY